MTEFNYIPEGYERIKVVDDLFSFFTTDFEPRANVVLFPRVLDGDFDALAAAMVKHFEVGEEEVFIKYKDIAKCEEFGKTLNDPAQKAAFDTIMTDLECLNSAGVRAHLRILNQYKIHADTYKFHVDGLDQDFDRFMVCYNNPVTQYVRNEDVLEVSGHDAVCKQGAKIYEFKVGDMFKSRVRNKPKHVLYRLADQYLKFEKRLRLKEDRAFVHRAQPSDTPRILVVGDKSV